MNNNERIKVAIYVRVSTQDQNLENQTIPLIKYCSSMGWDYTLFKEKESTRKTRPIQWDLYNRLLRKEFDGLVIYKFDRWARSTKELIEHVERLVDKGVKIYSYSDNIDLSNAMGRAMLTIISAFAQLERDIISERTNAGLLRAKATGKIGGRHPFDCGCGKNGHKGFLKPLRNERNIFIGWLDTRTNEPIEDIREFYKELNNYKHNIRKRAREVPTKENCEVCSSKKNLERHHYDYNLHYDKFMTLCVKCHKNYEKQTPPVQPLLNTEEIKKAQQTDV